MIRVEWSEWAARDLDRIFGYWEERDPEVAVAVVTTLTRRIHWLADDHYFAGKVVSDLPPAYRWYLQRRYGYKIFYRIEGDPTEVLLVIRLRHARQRPLNPVEIRPNE